MQDMSEVDIVARTIYGESEGWNEQDAIAIACVIMNRVHYAQWANNAKAVCLQPWQFSCWNINDPNRERILRVNEDDAWFRACLYIARQALHGALTDPTQRSTHYYATYVPAPRWAKGKQAVYEVRHRNRHAHIFFNNIDTLPPANAAEALSQQRSLQQSRTVKAGQVASAATIGTLGMEAMQDIAAPATTQLLTLTPYFAYAKWGLLCFTLLGIGAMLWARIDDRRNGIR